jgi:NAD+ synthase (glutamine-hydrolysing)
MRIALLQINPTVGDLEGNAARMVEAAREAEARGAGLAVFPELSLYGYPPRDLLDLPGFTVDARARLQDLARQLPPELPVIAGCLDPTPVGARRPVHNAAALLRAGRVEAVAHKQLLPTYDVFDEDRYFEPGKGATVVEVGGMRFGIVICEDAWNDVDTPLRQRYDQNPVQQCVEDGADAIVHISASPFTLRKLKMRPRMLARVAAHHRRPLIFVNQVGGNDELLFDGSSTVFGPDGSVWARARVFEEDILVCDLAPGGPLASQCGQDREAALLALTTGVRDYAHKCGFDRVVLGLSGGIDSELVACIAARALGPQNVLGLAMPTRYSSQGSLQDAEALTAALGIELRVISIDAIFQRYLDELGPVLDQIDPAPARDTTFENLQARIRGAVLMAVANRSGRLVLNTGNKSEIAAGYCTLYGDAVGALAVIGDLSKTLVYEVAREVNRQAGRPVIPENVFTKAPSAELRPGQTDQDSLPPYGLLDAILHRLVEKGESPAEVIAGGLEASAVRQVAALVVASEHKRRQMPPALIVTDKAFGPGRRYPIAQRYRG